ncbi:DUF2378 family protein [Nannocystaceae bacterium ST9]
MVEPRELEFSPPRDHIDLDARAILAAVPQATTNKRIFVQLAAKLVGDRLSFAELLARAGVPASTGELFDDIAWHDYFRVLVVVAELLHGPVRLSVGLREIGRCFYPGVSQTIVGRMMLGRHLGEVVRQAAETWQQFNTIGRVRGEFLSERHFRYHFEDYPLLLTETVGIGIFEGVFRHHHMPATISICRIDSMHSMIDVRW